MVGIIFGVSILLFIGSINFFLASRKPGIYPPKKLLKKRAGVFAIGGAVLFLAGLLFSLLG
ncbi:hypothetical protein [Bacillus sp. T33-2]|uniref:hypothetical protein n=1 Tax=Bacillus sp. T33-2 TaxID=2054168 RepID=UPI000C79027D|nr:hypothetical protein [Bacillus sp. T33-2]PLR89960.1 hypothetical protein CVD19_23085 [Bacillus sp. T33-2]